MNSFGRTDLKNLSALLNLDISAEDSKGGDSMSAFHPSYFPYTAKNQEINTESNENVNSLKDFSKNIWSDDEVPDEVTDETKNKIKPEYEIVYQQSVTPDDVFLQISGKDPGSHSCESLIVKIKLPGIMSVNEVSLNTSSLKLICKAKKFYLNLDLPKSVDPVQSTAKWLTEENILAVKLFFDAQTI